jgi:RNA polymerase sigma-70 factor (ECF subfamily)
VSAEEEAWLVSRAKHGDVEAFESLVRTHAQFAYNLALRVLSDPHEAEDVTQDAFLRAWRALPRFRDEARFKTWLYRIVVNRCYDRLPKLSEQLAALDNESFPDVVDERIDAHDLAVADETRRRVHGAIDDLPEGYRMLITLRHLQEMSYAEISEATGMPLGTVKVGLHRARGRLRDALLQAEADAEACA